MRIAAAVIAFAAALVSGCGGSGEREQPARKAAVSFGERPGRVVVTNDDGRWTVRTRCETRRGLTAGPGYISRLVRTGGEVLVDDLREAGPLNDPEFGGLGGLAWHHARGRPGRLRFGRENAWEVSVRDCAASNRGFGVSRSRVVDGPRRDGGAVALAVEVELSDGFTHPRPLLRARYEYRFERDVVRVRVELEPRCPGGRCGRTRRVAFVKEPKVVAHVTGGGFTRMATLRDDGTLACSFRGGGGETGPVLETGQCDDPDRARLRFDFGTSRDDPDGGCTPERPCLQVTVRDAELDAWAVDAAEGPPAFERDTASIDDVVWDCHGGDPASPMQRRWEVTGRKNTKGDYVALGGLFPAWEGGRGGYDCEPLSRPFPAAGKRYAVELDYRLVGSAEPP